MDESRNHLTAIRRREIVRILTEQIQNSAGGFVLAAATPEKIHVTKDDYGAKPGDFTIWFRENFPEFTLKDGQITMNTPLSNGQPNMVNREVSQMHNIAFMKWWSNNLLNLRPYSVSAAINANDLRNQIAARMAAAILTGHAGFIDATMEEPSRFAFDTGLTSWQGNPIYCVIGKNNTLEKDKQHWSFIDFCFPGEVAINGLGAWLANHMPQTDSRISYLELKNKLQETKILRDELAAFSWEENVLSGCQPSPAFLTTVQAYYKSWAELTELMAQMPSVQVDAPVSLDRLIAFADHQTAPGKLAALAAEKCIKVIHAILPIYEKNHFPTGVDSTPECDRLIAERVLEDPDDESKVETLQGLLQPYQDLLTLMDAHHPQDVESEIDRVVEHFREISIRLVGMFIDLEQEDKVFRDDLREANELLSQYRAEKRKIGTTQPETEECTSLEELYQSAVSSPELWKGKWVSQAGRMLPSKTRKLLYETLSEEAEVLEPSVRELTPYSAGCKLLDVQGNQEHEAEKCFLLGLLYDAQRCAPALLKLYRQEGRSGEFSEIWSRYVENSSGIVLPAEEQLYALSTLTDRDRGPIEWERLERFLDGIRGSVAEDDIAAILAPLAEAEIERPRAFWSWAGAYPAHPNELETAIADNDSDQIFALLANNEKLYEMGYGEEKLEAIRARVENNKVRGLDSYSKAQRLLSVLGKNNKTAEMFLWASGSNENSQRELFDRYYDRGDYASVCWIVSHFSMSLRERLPYYAKALVACGDSAVLEPLMERHPELWYIDGALRLLSEWEGTEDTPWPSLLAWHLEHPMAVPCPFEQALEAGDQTAALAFLEDAETMAAWGYGDEQLQQMRVVQADWPEVTGRGSTGEIAARIIQFQGNTHRFLEQYLYRQVWTDRSETLKLLFALMCRENRCREAAAYYRTNTKLFPGEANKALYLRCLVSLRDYDEVSVLVKENPRLIQRDEELALAVFRLSNDCGHHEFEDQISQMVKRMPWNRFEESIINLDLSIVQQMVSDPAQLIELNYSQEEIDWFKSCLSKPIMKGSDGYSVASRMRLFFGDSRAEPFFSEAVSDPRAAKVLLAIYRKAEKWDKLCSFYREHLDEKIWDSEQEKEYIRALSKASDPENCREFLNIVRNNPGIDQENTETKWLCLRALGGAQLWDEAESRETELLSKLSDNFRINYAMPYLYVLWNNGSPEAQERAVAMAGKLYLRRRSKLTAEGIRQLLTINGLLTPAGDDPRWIQFLRDRGLEDAADILAVTVGTQDKEELCRRLLTRIREGGDPLTEQELLICAEIPSWSGLDETLCAEIANALLDRWAQLLKTGGEEQWTAFLSAVETGAFNRHHAERIAGIWAEAMNSADDLAERTSMESCGLRLYQLLNRQESGIDEAWNDAMGDKLAEALFELLERQALHCDEAEWERLSGYFRLAKLSPAQYKLLVSSWMDYLDSPEAEGIVFYERILLPMEEQHSDWEYADICADHVAKYLCEIIRERSYLGSDTLYKWLKKGISDLPLNDERAGLLAACFASERYTDAPELFFVLLERIQGQWPQLAYELLKNYCLSVENNSEEYKHALVLLMQTAERIRDDIPCEAADQNLLYDAAKLLRTDNALFLLKECFAKAGKSDQIEILTILAASDGQSRGDGEPDRLDSWLLEILSTRDIQWLERYSAWWAPLVRLSGEDLQAKEVVSYLGVSGEPVSESLRRSVSRLLLSNLHGGEYIKCFLRIRTDLPKAVSSKLEYFTALDDPSRIDTSVEHCIENRQYDLALRLLLKKMNLGVLNSSQVGQKLGIVYTTDTVSQFPELTELAPAVLQGIKAMNQRDPQGIWKNLGRAVNIACVTKQECGYFETFGRDVARDYPAWSAALIANVILRGDFADAKRCLEMTAGAGSAALLPMIGTVLSRCLETGVLSERDELMLRIVPMEGNSPTMESYGQLASFAFNRGLRKECAQAMRELLQYSDDRALLAACQYLSALILPEWDLRELYRLSRQVVTDAALPYAADAAKRLAILQCCLPEDDPCRGESIYELYCTRVQDLAERAQMTNSLRRIHEKCTGFLHEPGDADLRRDILIRAATGWWRMDAGVADLLLRTSQANGWDLLKDLVDVSPQTFATACYRFVLLNRSDSEAVSGNVASLMNGCGREKWAESLKLTEKIAPERIEAICDLLDRPLLIAGMNTATLETIMQSGSPAQAGNELRLFFASRPSFSLQYYRNNGERLKEVVESRYPEFRTDIPRMLTRINAMLGDDSALGMPGDYLDMRDYVTTARAAERLLHDPNMRNNKNLGKLNKAYKLLGEIMSEQCGEKQLNNLKLYQILNMANLLCSSKAYPDLELFMDQCLLKPKWKICVRCLQELIQGCPRNVMYVMRDEAFLQHNGCSAAVASLIAGFVGAGESDSRTGLYQLLQENHRTDPRRKPKWGFFTEQDMLSLPNGTYPRSELLFVNKRNPAEFSRSFVSEIDDMLKDLRKYDEDHGISEENPQEPNRMPNELQVNIDFKRIPYILEQTERWRYPQEEGPEDEEHNAADARSLAEQREELEKKEQTAVEPMERIECLSKLIAIDWNQEGSVKTYLYCAELGFCLFEQRCESSGYHVVAPPAAREVLYAVSAFLPGIFAKNQFTERLKRYIQICLSSYDDLFALISDCGKPALAELCDSITDADVRTSYLKLISLVGEFGEAMSRSLNNTERLSSIKTYIEKAGMLNNPTIASPARCFVDLLNRQIQMIQRNAVITVTVYNQRSALDADSAFLYGEITNTGSAEAADVELSLRVNGVHAGRYALDLLPGNRQMPFELEFEVEDLQAGDTLEYALTATYKLSVEEEQEETRPLSGTLELYDPYEGGKKLAPYHYQVDVPVENEEYQERVGILNTLNMYYGEGKAFTVFPNLAVYGMRRTGKSSVLHRIGRLLRETRGDSVLCAAVSAEGTGDAAPEEKAYLVMVMQVLNQLLNDYRETLGLSGPAWDDFYARWSKYSVSTGDYEWLDEFYSELTRDWTKDWGLVVLADEVERIYITSRTGTGEENVGERADGASDEDGPTVSKLEVVQFWDLLSRITQRPGSKVRFVFCGSDSFTNTVNSGDNLTQFFQRIERLNIGRMTRTEIDGALRRAEQFSDIRFHPDALDYLWYLLKGLPWHSKHIVNRIIKERLKEIKRPEIYPSDILWSVEKSLSSNYLVSDQTLGLTALGKEERCIVNVLAETLEDSAQSLSAAELYALVSQQIQCEEGQFERAIRMLASERQLLTKSTVNREVHYLFGCELYRLHLRGDKGLSQFFRCM